MPITNLAQFLFTPLGWDSIVCTGLLSSLRKNTESVSFRNHVCVCMYLCIHTPNQTKRLEQHCVPFLFFVFSERKNYSFSSQPANGYEHQSGNGFNHQDHNSQNADGLETNALPTPIANPQIVYTKVSRKPRSKAYL